MTDLRNLLFLDIETVAAFKSYNELPERMQPLWDKKAGFLRNEDQLPSPELYWDRAAIYAEFGKVIVISIGVFNYKEGEAPTLRVKSLKSDNEKELLLEFRTLLQTKFDQDNLSLVAHNGKEFDFPYLCRRMLVNGLKLPEILDTSAKKPWEVSHIDTMEMWKFGDRKSFTSLDLLTAIFDIPSSKSDIDGSMVTDVYYNKNGLGRIAEYCANDVIATAQLYLKMNCLDIIPPDRIAVV
ncbi:MAG: 3'-5' exonuclease [Cyclobacteriaceae bacterium]